MSNYLNIFGFSNFHKRLGDHGRNIADEMKMLFFAIGLLNKPSIASVIFIRISFRNLSRRRLYIYIFIYILFVLSDGSAWVYEIHLWKQAQSIVFMKTICIKMKLLSSCLQSKLQIIKNLIRD